LPDRYPELGNLVAIDGSLIDATLSMYWADYRKGAKKAKVHVGFDLNRSIPRKDFFTKGNGAERPFVSQILSPEETSVWIYLRPLNPKLGSFSAVGNWLLSLLFLADAFWWKKIIFQIPRQKELRFFMFLLMVLGMVMYPLVEIFTEMTWPGMVLFGAGCPTNTFVTGLLVGSLPRTNKFFLALISTIAVIMGSHCAWTGIAADWIFFMSGIVGWAMLARYWDRNTR